LAGGGVVLLTGLAVAVAALPVLPLLAVDLLLLHAAMLIITGRHKNTIFFILLFVLPQI